MTPREAAAVEYQEPDWRELFETECARHPQWSRYLQQIDAFEEVMRRWRRFHWTPIEIKGEQKKMPAGATEAIIALSGLGIMPPRSEYKDIHDGLGYQHDDHMWISISGEQWKIAAIEDRMLILEKMAFDDRKPETRQIDLNRADWTKHTEAELAVLKAMSEKRGP
jgi:hypothetical protein